MAPVLYPLGARITFGGTEISKLKEEIFVLRLKQAWAVLFWGWKPFGDISAIPVAQSSEKAKRAQGDANQ